MVAGRGEGKTLTRAPALVLFPEALHGDVRSEEA